MKNLIALLALVVGACADQSAASIIASALTGTPGARGCFDPADYRAFYPEATDDRLSMQRAIDEACFAGGGEVCIGPGTFNVSRAPAGSYNRFAALSWHCPNVNVRGAGIYATTIRMSGDVGSGTAWVLALDPGVSGSTLTDFTIDTADTYNQDEQSHAIAVGTGVCATAITTCTVAGCTVVNTCAMPVADVTVQRVRFVHPHLTGERKGDCVRIAGNTPETEARNVKLLDLNLTSCARSGIGMQRNANHVTVSRCFFDGDRIGGTMLDGEATGGGWQRGLIVEGNHFVRTLPGGDTYGLSLTSQTHYSVQGNIFIGRGMNAYRSSDGSIEGNVFDLTDALATTAAIDLGNLAADVSIKGNRIRRRGGAGQLIKVQPHSGVFPGPLTIMGNNGTNETDGAAIMLGGVQDATVSGNKLVGNGGPNSMGIYVFPSGRQVENLGVNDNRIRGMTYAAVRLAAGGGFGFVATTLGLNTSHSSGPLRCDNATLIPAGGVVAGLNNWSTPSACAAVQP